MEKMFFFFFSINGARTTRPLDVKRIKVDTDLRDFAKISSKGIIDFNVKYKIIKLVDDLGMAVSF